MWCCAMLMQPFLSYPLAAFSAPWKPLAVNMKTGETHSVGSNCGGRTCQTVLWITVVASLLFALPSQWLWLNLLPVLWMSGKGKPNPLAPSKLIKLVCVFSCWRYKWGDARAVFIGAYFLSYTRGIAQGSLLQNPQEVTGETGEKGSFGLGRRKIPPFCLLMKAEKSTQQRKRD